ncbi:competence type IV pilus major pilin ComGC [Enterococcus faecalis]
MKKRKKNTYEGFTLLEMLIVLFILSVLILLFVPNLSKHKETVNKKGDDALLKVVDAQIELYSLEKNRTPSLTDLVNEGYITQEQSEKYRAVNP